VHINWLAVVAATVVGMVVASLWYAKIFLSQWQRLTGVTPEESATARGRNMAQLLISNFATAVGLAGAISVTAAAIHSHSWCVALLVGAFAWLTISAPTLVQHNAFELKSAKLTLLNNSYQLVLFLAMSLTIVAISA
jgi:hypothetical protein